MKKTQFFASVIVTLLLTVALVAKGDDFKQGVAKVVRIVGSGDFATVAGGDFKPITLGQYLSPGAVVRTSKDSKVDVVIEEGFDFTFRPDPHHSAAQPPIGFPPPRGIVYVPPARQTVIRLMSGTTVQLDKIDYYTTGADIVSHTEVDVQTGTIFFNVKKLTALSTFKMKTKVSVGSIRGSSGWTSANGDTGMFTGSEEVNGTYIDSNGQTQSYTEIISEGQELLNNDNGGAPSIQQNPNSNNNTPEGNDNNSHPYSGNNNTDNHPSGY